MLNKKDYNFKEDYARGLEGEEFLDDFFARQYSEITITPVNIDTQRNGVDRIFSNEQRTWNVEYKTDYIAEKTQNIFLEMTVNHYPTPKLGWVVGSQADILIYYIPKVAVYSIPFSLLRTQLDTWVTQLGWRLVINNRRKKNQYSAYGMLLPLWRLEKDIKVKCWKF